MRRNLVCGLIALVLAVTYLNESSKIQISALGDTVGSAGFPLILGWLLAGTAVLLMVQAFLTMRTAGADEPSGGTEDEAEERSGSMFKRAAGLTLIAVAFIVMLPFLGYIVSVALMLAAVMLYQGLPFSRRTGLVAAGGALFLYGLFGLLLGIPVPMGFWVALFG
jgi:putative tricarboxylic transport membrane protein